MYFLLKRCTLFMLKLDGIDKYLSNIYSCWQVIYYYINSAKNNSAFIITSAWVETFARGWQSSYTFILTFFLPSFFNSWYNRYPWFGGTLLSFLPIIKKTGISRNGAIEIGDALYSFTMAIGPGFPEESISISIPLSGISLIWDFVDLSTTGFLATKALKDFGYLPARWREMNAPWEPP